ncbi:MAG: DUF4837 family protein, partial [Bacteroidota bacterium]
AILTFGCKSSTNPTIPNVSGKKGEVMIVMDDSLWNDSLGQMLCDTLTQPHPALPQPEPMFDIYQVEKTEFSKYMQSHRNIIVAETGPQHEGPVFSILKDRWAKPQIIINMFAPTKKSWILQFKLKEEQLVSSLKHKERKRMMQYYRNNMQGDVVDSIKQNHHIKLAIPDGFYLNVNKDNFSWIWYEDPDILKGLIIYTYDYVDPNTFTKKFLVNKRNEVLRKNVPGRVEGSYMTTESKYEPDMYEITYKDRYFIQMRGLWKMENGDFMGGPFVSMTTLDKKRNKIITVEGYVYAPNKKKRNLVWEMEAILYTLKVLEDHE